MEIGGDDALAETQFGNVHGEFIRQIGHEGAHLQGTDTLDELTTLLHTHGVTADGKRNVDGDGLLFVDGEEIHVQAVVLDGVELQFVYDGGVGLAVEDEVHDVGSRRVQETLKIAIVNGEEDIVQTLAIEVAGNETLAAEGLDDGLVSDLADLAFQFKMLHAFCFKMCYSVRKTVRTPLHQKLFAFILGLQR